MFRASFSCCSPLWLHSRGLGGVQVVWAECGPRCNGPQRLRLNQVENSNLGGAGAQARRFECNAFQDPTWAMKRHWSLMRSFPGHQKGRFLLGWTVQWQRPPAGDRREVSCLSLDSLRGRAVASEDSHYEALTPSNGAATDEHLAHLSMMPGP